ncbi:MAG TPA: bifunctional diaminohydroxyphosphoribosylaminopyrimidine deaminase/5-amino-6-(5-phosphoribosylamino)uracil reductase RibD [Planctomycetota bacterium]|nr:bifunctional diaminohydroxyphosphoribosylaminopyrimidine deaminase/5-amino-6-(5-phosphoribosylamino)uracil reductase RibD [Planctomycetota bacterium]
MTHEIWMDEALALAERGRGWVSPNPMVGAVVVRDGNVVGRGWHREFGGPHAEVFALREAGEAARGAALYCTLEPCNHTGKTPPCTRAIIDAGIRTVVLGAIERNPVADGGIEALRAAGIEVVERIRECECFRINAPFFKFVDTKTPFVALKWAMSLDGKIATKTGDSKWITGESARAHAHLLRSRHDAVLVGIGTVLADDPALNVRGAAMMSGVRQPRRVVLDSRARTPLTGRLWFHPDDGSAGPLLIVISAGIDADGRSRARALRDNGAEIIEAEPDANGRVLVTSAIRELGARGVCSILVEGGAQVLGACVDAKIADRAHVFIAPTIIGGEMGKTAVGGCGTERVTLAIGRAFTSMTKFGGDYLIEVPLSVWGHVNEEL